MQTFWQFSSILTNDTLFESPSLWLLRARKNFEPGWIIKLRLENIKQCQIFIVYFCSISLVSAKDKLHLLDH